MSSELVGDFKWDEHNRKWESLVRHLIPNDARKKRMKSDCLENISNESSLECLEEKESSAKNKRQLK